MMENMPFQTYFIHISQRSTTGELRKLLIQHSHKEQKVTVNVLSYRNGNN